MRAQPCHVAPKSTRESLSLVEPDWITLEARDPPVSLPPDITDPFSIFTGERELMQFEPCPRDVRTKHSVARSS